VKHGLELRQVVEEATLEPDAIRRNRLIVESGSRLKVSGALWFDNRVPPTGAR